MTINKVGTCPIVKEFAMPDHLFDLAVRAVVYGFPMVYTVNEALTQVTNPRTTFTAPVNMIGAGRELAGPADEFVSLNNDTLYSVAHLDLTSEPQVLHVPDTHDRYYVMQCIDAWTNNFAYIGRRSTGTAEGFWLFAGPHWDGQVPDGVQVVHCPTNLVSINGRFAVDGPADLANVHQLQDQTWMTPLSHFPNRLDTSGRSFGDHDLAPWDRNVEPDLIWWEQFRSWSQLFPPANPDDLERFRPVGILESESPYRNPAPEFASLLTRAYAEGLALIDRTGRENAGGLVNGWGSALHMFDFNATSFGPGTINSPDWTLTDPDTAAMTRSIAALGGLWGNHGYEAAYFWTYADSSGDALTGTASYVLHLEMPPPVDAFWSMTMYDTEHYYLVDNPLNRYSIGDRTPGLVWNRDGSLDIFVQADDPGPDRRSNWLPAPPAPFRPLVRMYQPRPSVLNGTYTLPAFQKVEGTASSD
jgi:hypothetical protein